jgi:hypothetical protein
MGDLDLDISATRADLSSSSTPLRIGRLRAVDERLSQNGTNLGSEKAPWRRLLLISF